MKINQIIEMESFIIKKEPFIIVNINYFIIISTNITFKEDLINLVYFKCP